MTIGSAGTEDSESLWPLVRDFARSFEPEREAFERTFPALLDRVDTLLAVVRRNDTSDVVGYALASARPTFLANGPVCWVEELMVASSERRAGVGTRLMAHVERWAAAEGCAYVSLASRRAGHFYRAIGYEESATFFRRNLVTTGGSR